MMIGVAQVIGMKPTLRSFFSGAPAPCANTSVAVLSGKNCASAASAVEAPTDFRNARRAASCGNIARIDRGGDDVLVALVLALHGGERMRAASAPHRARSGWHAGRRGSRDRAGGGRHRTDCRTVPMAMRLSLSGGRGGSPMPPRSRRAGLQPARWTMQFRQRRRAAAAVLYGQARLRSAATDRATIRSMSRNRA